MAVNNQMLLPAFHKSFNPLLFIGERLYAAKGNSIYEVSADLSKKVRIGNRNSGFLNEIVARQSILSRILRRGFHGMAANEKNDIAGVMNGEIVLKRAVSNNFEPVYTDFRGSRPLKLTYAQSQFLFGEYFGNSERDQVHIYASTNGTEWNRIYTFLAGSIRHVHGIVEDPYRNGLWVLTGDSNEESAIWFTDDNFVTLRKVIHGSQKARAVNIIVRKDSLIIPMDSPLEQNYIQRYDFATEKLEAVAAIPGSAFHAIESDGIMLVSTVTEPSEINRTDAATLWGSLDGTNWKCVCELQKDSFPVKWQHVFRYAEIVLTPGKNETPYITAYGRALSKYDNCLLAWRKDDLKAFLRN